MNVIEEIYEKCNLSKNDFSFSIMESLDLRHNFHCKYSNDDRPTNKKISIYQEKALLRVLAVKSDILTQDLLTTLYSHADVKKIALIINWKPYNYTYLIITVQSTESDSVSLLKENYEIIRKLVYMRTRRDSHE